MSLPLVPTDSQNEKQHRTILATTLNELVKLYPREGSWTATIRGSGTAGTYEIASQQGRYTRIGRRVWLDVYIIMAGTVTGGGTATLLITGAPFTKAADTYPVGSVRVDGVDLSASVVQIVLGFGSTAESSTLIITEIIDNASAAPIQIGTIAANDVIFGSICYETDDP